MPGSTKLWIVLAAIVVLAIGFCGIGVSYSNAEIRERNLIEAKQKDNTSEFDNMWKKISQVAEVPAAERESLKDLFVSNSQARTTGGSQDGSLMKWVTEAVPNVNNDLYKQLINTITGSRDAWTMRQKEILDHSRVHNDLIKTMPSRFFVGIFGQPGALIPIEIQIVTSTRTGEAFKTGKDDDTQLFKKK